MLPFRRIPWWSTGRDRVSWWLGRAGPHVLSFVGADFFPSTVWLTGMRSTSNWSGNITVDSANRTLCASHLTVSLVPSPKPLVPHVLIDQTIYTLALERRPVGSSSHTSRVLTVLTIVLAILSLLLVVLLYGLFRRRRTAVRIKARRHARAFSNGESAVAPVLRVPPPRPRRPDAGIDDKPLPALPASPRYELPGDCPPRLMTRTPSQETIRLVFIRRGDGDACGGTRE